MEGIYLLANTRIAPQTRPSLIPPTSFSVHHQHILIVQHELLTVALMYFLICFISCLCITIFLFT
jgi:hypothetical protein